MLQHLGLLPLQCECSSRNFFHCTEMMSGPTCLLIAQMSLASMTQMFSVILGTPLWFCMNVSQKYSLYPPHYFPVCLVLLVAVNFLIYFTYKLRINLISFPAQLTLEMMIHTGVIKIHQLYCPNFCSRDQFFWWFIFKISLNHMVF